MAEEEVGTMKRVASILTMVVVGGFGLVASAAAQTTDTATLNVSATVVDKARITSVTDIAFGNYDPTASTPTDADGSVTVRATKDLAYEIYITGTREMSDGSGQTLDYELYSDSGRTTVWGASSGTGENFTSTSNAETTYTIYGRVSALQDVSAASFSDSVTVTVEY